MQHVGIGDHDVARVAAPPGAHRPAYRHRRCRRVLRGSRRVELEQLRDLVLRQRLGREKIERLGAFDEGALQHRQVVAEGLAGGGGRDDDRVPAGRDGVPGLP